MESNKTYHYIFKYVLLFVGVLIMVVSVTTFIFPGSIMINGEPGSIDITTTIVLSLLGLLLILIFLAIKDKFAILELRNQTITIKQNGEERTLSWLDVVSVSQIQFVQPPLYKLKVKGTDETIWFNTEPNYISINGFTSDLSEMGDLISKKKRELNL